MSFFDSVNALLEKNKIKLDYPINIVMGHKNSNFIDIELYEKDNKINKILEKKKIDENIKKKKINEILEENSIDEILKEKEIVSNDFNIVYKKRKNEIIFESEDNISIFRGKNNSLEDILDSYKLIGITKDEEFKIYICPLPENNKVTIDGISYNNDEIQYPDFNQFKYQNLYTYQDENTFINAVYIEFIVRNARYNYILSDIITIEEDILDNESEFEYDIRIMLLMEEKQKKIDEMLLQHYGLNSYEIMKLDLTIHKNIDYSPEEDVSIQLNFSEPSYNSTIDLRLPDKDYLDLAKKLKNEYKKNKNNFFPLEKRINKKFVKEANNIINKFPKSFEKKKDDLIKALFIFDYVQAHNKSIDELNIPTKEEYETKKIEINNKYSKKREEARKEIEKFEAYKKETANFEEKIRIEKQNTHQKTIDTLKKNIIGFERNEKKELREIEKKLKNKLEHHTKMDPSKYDDSIFNEIASIINEKPKQCTKIHNFIHKFLEKQITN